MVLLLILSNSRIIDPYFFFSNNQDGKDLNRKERAGQELAGNGYDSTNGLEPPTVWAIVPAVVYSVLCMWCCCLPAVTQLFHVFCYWSVTLYFNLGYFISCHTDDFI